MDNNWKCYDFIEGGKGKIPALKTFTTQTYLLGILKKKSLSSDLKQKGKSLRRQKRRT